MDQAIQAFFASIGRLLVVGGGGAVIAFGLFRWLGKRWLKGWIDQYFQKQLEEFKHEKNKELEQLRHDINTLFSRISKVHEKEFEVLPNAWKLLNEANGRVFQLIKALREWPEFSRLSSDQLEAFLKHSRLLDFQKEELRAAPDQLKYYEEKMFWIELDDAKNARAALNNYLALNSIFMTPDLREKFGEINRALINVISCEQVEHTSGHNDSVQKSRDGSLSRIEDLFGKIEIEVQKRLRYDDA